MLAWITPPLRELFRHYLQKGNYIPDYLGYYSPRICEGLPAISVNKLIPSRSNNHLHKEKNLFFDEVEPLACRFRYTENINVVAISEVSIEAIAPFLHELIQLKNQLQYTTVTPNSDLNKLNTSQIKEFDVDNQINAVHSIVVEPELENFYDYINRESQPLVSIFTLLDSRLGNSPDPARFLTNIADSMAKEDILIILQGLYNPLNKEKILMNYESVLNEEIYAVNDNEIAEMFDVPYHKYVIWSDDLDGYRGIDLRIKFLEQAQYDNLSFAKNTSISLFRSLRFTDQELSNLFHQSGLYTFNATYDREGDFALYILKKT